MQKLKLLDITDKRREDLRKRLSAVNMNVEWYDDETLCVDEYDIDNLKIGLLWLGIEFSDETTRCLFTKEIRLKLDAMCKLANEICELAPEWMSTEEHEIYTTINDFKNVYADVFNNKKDNTIDL